MAKYRTWTDEQLIEAIKASRSVAGVIRYLGLKVGGGTQANLIEIIQDLGLDTSHFTGMGWNRGTRRTPEERAATLIPLLRKGKRISKLRDRLIVSGLKEAKCEECGLRKWQDKPAPLQVDHTDGDHLNNELSNLRILCANCHMLTETWGFKNGRRRKVWTNGDVRLSNLNTSSQALVDQSW